MKQQNPTKSSDAFLQNDDEDDDSSNDEDDLIAKLQSSGMPTKR